MGTHDHAYDGQVVPYPKLRQALGIMMASVRRKRIVHGLIEVDVTEARQLMRAHKTQTGESLSLTAFIIACVVRAVDEDKYLHACRKGGSHLILYDDVDVATQVERDVGGQKQPVTYILRAANRKTLREIHDEIRAAQTIKAEKAWTVASTTQWILHVPIFLFRLPWSLFWWARGRYPSVQKRFGGTIGVSAIGMFGSGGGWGIPLSYHTLDVTIGGIAVKPGIAQGQIAAREYLCVTLSFDHDIVDGAPAARFVSRLRELLESASALADIAQPQPQPAVTAAFQYNDHAGVNDGAS
ncbi:MAG TPA: 2-oxo acid dehydrogenase subunit E2 [Ktedonobacterales bacterium]